MRLGSIGSMVGFAALFALPACKDEQQCQRARSAASESWKVVAEAAAKNQVAPTIGLEELPPDQKQRHVEAWGTLAKQAEMVSASFLYDRITWNTADPAAQKANAAFDGYSGKQQFKTFEAQLKDANDKFKATTAACRD